MTQTEWQEDRDPIEVEAAELRAEVEQLQQRLQAEIVGCLDKIIEQRTDNERLRAALQELTADISSSAVLMDNISLAKFENACAALEPKP